MIERNLGNAERVVRLLLGVLMFGWAVQQPHMNPMEWFVTGVSVALILNGIFSRCYLWYVLDLDTCRDGEEDCGTDVTCP